MMQRQLQHLFCGLAIATLLIVPQDANSASPSRYPVVVPRNTTVSPSNVSVSPSNARAFPSNAGVILPNDARFPTRAASRAQIQQLPILERPDRFGHIYGNTVRRINRLRTTIENSRNGPARSWYPSSFPYEPAATSNWIQTWPIR